MTRHQSPPQAADREQPLFPGERAVVPAAVEVNSATAWAEFEKLQALPAGTADRAFAATVPGSLATTSPGTIPQAGTAPVAPGATAVSLAEVLVEARRYNRVCPHPQAWLALYDLLPNKQSTPRGMQPPPPITGPAWQATPAMSKRLCLRDHLEWADHHGALGPVMAFLKSLPEEAWLHMGE